MCLTNSFFSSPFWFVLFIRTVRGGRSRFDPFIVFVLLKFCCINIRTHIRFSNDYTSIHRSTLKISKYWNSKWCRAKMKFSLKCEKSKQQQQQLQHHVFNLLVRTLFGWSESIFKCLESFIPKNGSFSHRKWSENIQRNKIEKMKAYRRRK